MAGWIKLHRKILDNPVFLKPELYQLFSYCLLRANHSETKIIWNGQEEILEKGCFITGRKAIASDLEQKESTTYKRLKLLENLSMISVKSNNKFSVVKVLNYCIYQGEEEEKEQQSNNKGTTKEQQSNTDKNDKKYKNERSIYTPDESEILTYWNEKKIIQHGESEPIKKEIAKALKTYGKEKVKYAINNYSLLLHDESFYYSHRFTLETFLKQKNGIKNFLDNGPMWIEYSLRKKGGKPERDISKIKF